MIAAFRMYFREFDLLRRWDDWPSDVRRSALGVIMALGKVSCCNCRERSECMSALSRHPLVAFFVLTHALAWWVLPTRGPVASGPLIAALIMIPITHGWAGLRELDL